MNRDRDAKRLLRNVMRANPRASEKTIFDAFCDEIQQQPESLRAVIACWFVNHYKKLEVIEPARNSVAVIQREQAVRRENSRLTAREERKAVQQIKESLRTVLMDFVLSNGKQLRHATFGDCAVEGGWLLAIAKKGYAHEVVGKKLTEDDLHSLRGRFEKAAA